MIPSYKHGRVSNRSVLCSNPQCAKYGEIIGRIWASCCPICGELGDYKHLMDYERDLRLVCRCEMCRRRTTNKYKKLSCSRENSYVK